MAHPVDEYKRLTLDELAQITTDFENDIFFDGIEVHKDADAMQQLTALMNEIQDRTIAVNHDVCNYNHLYAVQCVQGNPLMV